MQMSLDINITKGNDAFGQVRRPAATLGNIRTQGADAVCRGGVAEDLGKDHGRGHGKYGVRGRGRVARVRRSSDHGEIPVRSDLKRQHEHHGSGSGVGVDDLIAR
jgi:hypothetical protein